MEQEKALKEMAKELVHLMDAEEAKSKFLAVIDGADLYDTILELPNEPPSEAKAKKKKGRRKKVLGPQAIEILDKEEKSF